MNASIPNYISDLTRAYGSRSLSFSQCQPGLSYFGDARRGAIAYRDRLGVRVALGDSLCAPERAFDLLAEFANTKPMMLFAQVAEATAAHLRQLGFGVTPIGVDSEIDVQRFHLRGKSMRDLRHYRNRAAAGGVTVHEEFDSSGLRDTLQSLSRVWLQRKRIRHREREFLVRPLVNRSEAGTRVFVGRIGDEAAAFVVFDPIYRDGRVEGYTATILRDSERAPEGTLDQIILTALQSFRAEGITRLSLGVSPMRNMDETAARDGRGRWPLFYACRMFSRMRWQPIVNVRGLSFHKSRYRAEERPVYVATKGRIGLWEMTALLRACRIF